jgi:hypothetical protein
MKYVNDRPYASPEAAARKLLEIVLAKEIGVGQYTYTGATNTAFLQGGRRIRRRPGLWDRARLVRNRPVRDEDHSAAARRGPVVPWSRRFDDRKEPHWGRRKLARER